MNLGTQEIVDLLFRYKYLILFPIAFLEGPTIAVISGFMIAAKFMAFWPVYIILISANLLGDLVYYFLGRLVPRKKLDKILTFFRVRPRQIERAEAAFIRNKKKAIIFGKMAHAVGSVFLITAGIVRIPLTEYLKVGTFVELPKGLAFIALGYYFGRSLSSLDKIVDYSVAGFIIFTIIISIIFHFIERYADKRLETLEKEQK